MSENQYNDEASTELNSENYIATLTTRKNRFIQVVLYTDHIVVDDADGKMIYDIDDWRVISIGGVEDEVNEMYNDTMIDWVGDQLNGAGDYYHMEAYDSRTLLIEDGDGIVYDVSLDLTQA